MKPILIYICCLSLGPVIVIRISQKISTKNLALKINGWFTSNSPLHWKSGNSSEPNLHVFVFQPLDSLKLTAFSPLKIGPKPQKERRKSSNHQFSGDKQLVSANGFFRVPVKGGRWHIIPQLAVYTTYSPCLLGGEK